MKVDLYNQDGKKIKTEEIPDNIFNLKINKDLLHQVIVAYQSNKKKITSHVKTRGQVRGGGAKPWRQKGTGRARHGSIRSPIWKGGGVIFGPNPNTNFTKKINKKMRIRALFMALSSKVKDKEFLLLDSLKLDKPKTKKLFEIIKKLISILLKDLKKKKQNPSVLIIVHSVDENLKRASKNIPKLEVLNAEYINAFNILSYKYLILLKDSIEIIKKRIK